MTGATYVIFSIVATLLMTIWGIWTLSTFFYYQDGYLNIKEPRSQYRNYTILYYNYPSWFGTNPTEINFFKGCKFQNCNVIFDTTLIGISDAVIFYNFNTNKAPKKRENQPWIYATLEAPYTSNKGFSQAGFNNNIEWTMTYRYDSEGVAPYGIIKERKEFFRKNYTLVFLKKKKDVAWVVSNCKTPSKREQYVNELSKYINVDIYGRCGTPCKEKSAEECKKMLSETYKFYLSFENSLCKDYMTEKIFTIYMDDMNFIPVVRGAPNIDERLPSNTYISSRDYKSPKDLAEFLKLVGKNETYYVSFLQEKDKYFYETNPSFHTGMCDICRHLHEKRRKLVPKDLNKWLWEGQCLNPRDI